jgi:hypothetical protein
MQNKEAQILGGLIIVMVIMIIVNLQIHGKGGNDNKEADFKTVMRFLKQDVPLGNNSNLDVSLVKQAIQVYKSKKDKCPTGLIFKELNVHSISPYISEIDSYAVKYGSATKCYEGNSSMTWNNGDKHFDMLIRVLPNGVYEAYLPAQLEKMFDDANKQFQKELDKAFGEMGNELEKSFKEHPVKIIESPTTVQTLGQ